MEDLMRPCEINDKLGNLHLSDIRYQKFLRKKNSSCQRCMAALASAVSVSCMSCPTAGGRVGSVGEYIIGVKFNRYIAGESMLPIVKPEY